MSNRTWQALIRVEEINSILEVYFATLFSLYPVVLGSSIFIELMSSLEMAFRVRSSDSRGSQVNPNRILANF